jgi:DNA-directed RNA polymerase subunit H
MVKKAETDKAEPSIDVAEHILVAQHRKMTTEERAALLKKYNIALIQLPKIIKSDPALENLDAIPGDVIEIDRDSATLGKSKYYRVVTHG